jgi:type III secretion protein S
LAPLEETRIVADRLSPSHRAVCAAVVAFLGLAFAIPACSASGEGDRCTYFMPTSSAAANVCQENAINGTDECQDGLVCYPATTFNTAVTGSYDRCCPMDLATATVMACQTAGTLDGGNPSSGRDGGLDGTSSEGRRRIRRPIRWEEDRLAGSGAYVIAASTLVEVARQALVLAALLSLPVIGVAAIVGLVVAALQAATQIQDPTIAHLPRIVAVTAALAILGPWMGSQVATFAERVLLLVR